jgi:hypothetical protein
MLSRTTSHNDDNLQNCHELQTGMNTTGFVPVSVHMLIAFCLPNHVKATELLLRLNYQKLETIWWQRPLATLPFNVGLASLIRFSGSAVWQLRVGSVFTYSATTSTSISLDQDR